MRTSAVGRVVTTFFTIILQGRAERAVRPWPPYMQKRRAPRPLSRVRRIDCPLLADTLRILARSRSPGLPLLGPARPHGGARHAPDPGDRPARTQHRSSIADARRRKRGHPSGALIPKPCNFAVKPVSEVQDNRRRSSCLAHVHAKPGLTASLARIQGGTSRSDGQDRALVGARFKRKKVYALGQLTCSGPQDAADIRAGKVEPLQLGALR